MQQLSYYKGQSKASGNLGGRCLEVEHKAVPTLYDTNTNGGDYEADMPKIVRTQCLLVVCD